jgi:hypothetical protein
MQQHAYSSSRVHPRFDQRSLTLGGDFSIHLGAREVSVSTVCAMKMVSRLNEVMTQRLINLTGVVLGSLGTLRTV